MFTCIGNFRDVMNTSKDTNPPESLIREQLNIEKEALRKGQDEVRQTVFS